MLELVIGGTPRGEDYFGREDLIETLWSRLRKDNVLLAAPRRFGKTGAMYRLLDAPRAPFRPLYINVEDITTAADFMVELLAALLRDRHFRRVLRELWQGTKELGGLLRNLPASIDLGGLKIELREKTTVVKDWKVFGEKVRDLLTREEAPLLLLIDEFANLASAIEQHKGRDELTRFLRWFRAARLAPDTSARFVLGSSINLLSTLDAVGLVDTVNDLAIVRLEPFSRETAERFVEQVFATRQMALTVEIRDEILEHVGTAIPYLLAVFLTAIFNRQRPTGGEVSSEMVHAAFEEDLLGGATAAVFQHYRSRLDRYYTASEARAAKAILGTLSRAAEPVEWGALYQLFLDTARLPADADRSEAFLQLMSKLENDFYVVLEEGRFAFFSRVLGAWWKARYGYFVE